MRGCIKLFPKHRLASIAEGLLLKRADRARTGGELASWDKETLEAIERFGRKAISEREADNIIRAANGRRDAYLRSRGWR